MRASTESGLVANRLLRYPSASSIFCSNISDLALANFTLLDSLSVTYPRHYCARCEKDLSLRNSASSIYTSFSSSYVRRQLLNAGAEVTSCVFYEGWLSFSYLGVSSCCEDPRASGSLFLAVPASAILPLHRMYSTSAIAFCFCASALSPSRSAEIWSSR